MASPDVIQLVGTLGFPIVMVLILLWFFNTRIWPWFTNFMQSYMAVLEKNTSAMQQMTGALGAVGDQIKAQPNQQLATAVTTLIERMDAQHLGLSQQVAAAKSEIIMAIGGNAGKIDRVYREIKDE